MAWSDAARAAALEARRMHAKQDQKTVKGVMRTYSKMSRLLIAKPNLSSSASILAWQRKSQSLFKTVARSHGFKMR